MTSLSYWQLIHFSLHIDEYGAWIFIWQLFMAQYYTYSIHLRNSVFRKRAVILLRNQLEKSRWRIFKSGYAVQQHDAFVWYTYILFVCGRWLQISTTTFTMQINTFMNDVCHLWCLHICTYDIMHTHTHTHTWIYCNCLYAAQLHTISSHDINNLYRNISLPISFSAHYENLLLTSGHNFSICYSKQTVN